MSSGSLVDQFWYDQVRVGTSCVTAAFDGLQDIGVVMWYVLISARPGCLLISLVFQLCVGRDATVEYSSVAVADILFHCRCISGLLEDESRKTRMFTLSCLRSLLLLVSAGSIPVELLHTAITGNTYRMNCAPIFSSSE